MKNELEISQLLAAFEEASQKHAEATEKGDYKTVNRNYDKVVQIVGSLKAQNKIDHLLSFLNHPQVGVRLAAATFLLSIYEKEAIKALGQIEKSDCFQSLDAEMTLEEWRNGNLKV